MRPRHEAHAALGQLPLDELVLGVEEHEVDAPRVVLAGDLVGRLVVAARRRAMLEHPHLQRGDGARHGCGHRRRGAPVDHPGRRMPEQVDDARLGHAGRQPQRLLEQQLHARPDAGKVRRRGEQGNERMRPHGSVRVCVPVQVRAPRARAPTRYQAAGTYASALFCLRLRDYMTCPSREGGGDGRCRQATFAGYQS